MNTLPLPFATSKTCPTCGTTKPLTDFGGRQSNRDGRRSQCRSCENRKAAEYRLTHPDRVRASQAAWLAANPDKRRAIEAARYTNDPEGQKARHAKYRREHPDRRRATERAWRERNKDRVAEWEVARWVRDPEKVRAKNRKSYARNKGRRKAYRLAYLAEHRDEIAAKCRAYHAAHREEVAAKKKAWRRDNPAAYRAIKRASRDSRLLLMQQCVREDFTHGEIFDRDKWVCGLCGEPVDASLRFPDPRSASLDHVVPLSRGGDHVRANVQLAHLGCNWTKGAVTRKRNRRDDHAAQAAASS